MKNFKDLIKEIKKENKQELVKKQKGMSFDFNQPFNKKKLDEINTINKINEIIKYRDLPMEKVSYEHWLKVLQNKMVDELHPGYAKKLYEQDMSRVEKYEELKKKSGKGRNKIAVTTEDPFTPADLLNAASPDGAWYDSTDATKNTFHSNNGLSQWDESAGKTAPIIPYSAPLSAAPTTFPNSAATRGFSGAAKTANQGVGIDMPDTTGFTLANGNPWTVGWVLYIPQSSVNLSGGTARARIHSTVAFSLGFRSDTETIWADQRGSYDHISYIRKTGVTAGTYVIIATQDGTASGLKLYVNGVDQGAQSDTHFGQAKTGFRVDTRFNPDVVFGDILVMERALTSAEVTTLNSYWTTKFI